MWYDLILLGTSTLSSPCPQPMSVGTGAVDEIMNITYNDVVFNYLNYDYLASATYVLFPLLAILFLLKR